VKRTITLSDGTDVEIKAPGISFELEALGGVPNLGLLGKTGAADLEFTAADELKLRLLGICHGAVSPRFSMEPKPPAGWRYVGDLLPPDVRLLGDGVAELRVEAMAEAEATLNPTSAGVESSEAPANSLK